MMQASVFIDVIFLYKFSYLLVETHLVWNSHEDTIW